MAPSRGQDSNTGLWQHSPHNTLVKKTKAAGLPNIFSDGTMASYWTSPERSRLAMVPRSSPPDFCWDDAMACILSSPDFLVRGCCVLLQSPDLDAPSNHKGDEVCLRSALGIIVVHGKLRSS